LGFAIFISFLLLGAADFTDDSFGAFSFFAVSFAGLIAVFLTDFSTFAVFVLSTFLDLAAVEALLATVFLVLVPV